MRGKKETLWEKGLGACITGSSYYCLGRLIPVAVKSFLCVLQLY